MGCLSHLLAGVTHWSTSPPRQISKHDSKKMTSTDKDTVVDMRTESYYELHFSSRRLLGIIPQLQPRGTYVGGQIVGCLRFDLRGVRQIMNYAGLNRWSSMISPEERMYD